MSGPTPAPKGYRIALVRDGTPDLINHSGEPGDLWYETLPPAARGHWLRRKLGEEVTEYLEARSVEELSHVLAVVEGLAALHELTLAELLAVVRKDPRGGFLEGKIMVGRHPEYDR